MAALEEHKNQELLIRTFAEVYGGDPRFRLVFVGSGPDRDKLEGLTSSLRLSDQVCFLGQLGREALRTALWEADCFVLTSRVETFGVVLIEAMACGLPLIAISSPGPRSIVTLPELGSLIQDSRQSLTNALRWIPQENFDPKPIREHTVRHYSFQAVAARLVEIYERIQA